jgi:serine/threonine protein kinase
MNKDGAYEAPEGYSSRSDMWSLGMILIEMVYGNFKMLTVAQAAAHSNTHDIPFVLKLPDRPLVTENI